MSEETTPRAEWKGRAAFAEIAEALGVESDRIMAASVGAHGWVVLYSPAGTDVMDGAEIHTATLRRDRDDVLRLVSVSKPLPGLWAEMSAAIEARLRDELGPPDDD